MKQKRLSEKTSVRAESIYCSSLIESVMDRATRAKSSIKASEIAAITFSRPVPNTATRYGHEIIIEEPDLAFGFGGAQLIHRLEGGGYAGGSDPRKDGCAVGF